MVIIVVLAGTRIASFSAVVALAVPTVAVVLFDLDVAQVKDQGDIPRGIPLPAWPQLSAFSWSLLAGARTLQEHLPDPAGTEAPAVVLRMRGRTMLGSTFFSVLTEYTKQVVAVGGRVCVSGLAPELVEQAKRTGTVADDGPVKLYQASTVIGESSLDAFHDAPAWVAAQPPDADA